MNLRIDIRNVARLCGNQVDLNTRKLGLVFLTSVLFHPWKWYSGTLIKLFDQSMSIGSLLFVILKNKLSNLHYRIGATCNVSLTMIFLSK